jgi:hypothetical protein
MLSAHKNISTSSINHYSHANNLTFRFMTFTTIDTDGPWEYLDLLNECLKILLTVLIGIIMGHFKVFDAATFCPQATRFVFFVALPLLVLKGLGVGIDFNSTSLWSYVAAFLIIRVVALLISIGVFLRNKDKSKSVGEVAVVWLAQSWISTVILGVPICTAVFGDATKGTTYGIMAGTLAHLKSKSFANCMSHSCLTAPPIHSNQLFCLPASFPIVSAGVPLDTTGLRC